MDDWEVLSDGGHDSNVGHGTPIDPLVCLRGHHSVSLNATRFNCLTYRNQEQDQTSWDCPELVDLRKQDLLLQDDRDLVTDDGSEQSSRDTEQTKRFDPKEPVRNQLTGTSVDEYLLP